MPEGGEAPQYWREEEKKRKKEEKVRARDTQQQNINNNVLAVMFIPFTKNSGLAIRYRQSEGNMGALCDYRLKFVERAGKKISDILTTSNPWRGQDCERDRCVPCDTKERTGKDKGQDCSKRSLVYETWCLECELKEKEKIEKRDDLTEIEKKEMMKRIRLYKYVGETSRSLYERGWEHVHAKDQLHSNSHMLKHAVEEHPGGDLLQIKFGMRAITFCRSSFERQIMKACKIQEERVKHTILNSKSEFNRSAVLRIMTKL